MTEKDLLNDAQKASLGAKALALIHDTIDLAAEAAKALVVAATRKDDDKTKDEKESG